MYLFHVNLLGKGCIMSDKNVADIFRDHIPEERYAVWFSNRLVTTLSAAFSSTPVGEYYAKEEQFRAKGN